jgi:hypothetical protein
LLISPEKRSDVSGVSFSLARPSCGLPDSLERLQVLDEILLLLFVELEPDEPVVVRDDVEERGSSLLNSWPAACKVVSMRRTKHFTLATTFLVLATGVVYAGTAGAQPQPPMPPGMSAPPMPGDLHVRIVQEARPALRHEVEIERLGPHHVWIKGYWHHTGQAWGWNDGRWSEPPRSHTHWVGARYQKVKGGYRYTPGHWSHEHVIYN